MTAKELNQQATDNYFSLISDEKLLALHAALLKCRTIARKLGSRSKMRTRGRRSEQALAAAVGVAIDLLPGDTLAASGAGALARVVKSGFTDPALRGIVSAGSARRVSGAAALKAALRAALAHKGRVNKGEKGQGEKSTKIAVAVSEHSSATAQLWRESLREAARKRLPILFVCSAEEETEDVQSLLPKSRLPFIVVDSNDVVAIYRVASEAIAHARRGNGPTLIVCRAWPLVTRRSAHHADPILNMEKYLAGKRLYSAEFKRRTISRFARELRSATSLPDSANKES